MEGAGSGTRAIVARSLSVVIPAYNEATSIDWSIRATRSGLDALLATGLVATCEIVVVDDHSTDDTLARIEAAGAAAGVATRAVPGQGARGLGSAIRQGLAAATGDLVVYTDADLPFDPAELPRMIEVLDRYEADVLCGYRLDRTSEGFRRAAQSHAFNLLARALLPISVRDINFACKVFTRQALDLLLPELRSDGPFIDAELVARCSSHRLRLVQTGVDYFPRFDGASTLGGPSAIADIVREGAGMARELRRRR